MIEDVINDVRDIFLDDGVDEQVLMELKTVSLYFPPLKNILFNQRLTHTFSIEWTFVVRGE